MQDIAIHWSTGEMHLTAQFFTQGVTKARKVFKLLLQDDDWDSRKVRQLAEDLIEWARELDTDAQNQRNFAKASREEAKTYKKDWKRGTPLPPQYHHYVKQAAQEEQIAKQFHRYAENVRRASSLLLEMWEEEHD